MLSFYLDLLTRWVKQVRLAVVCKEQGGDNFYQNISFHLKTETVNLVLS